jgi:hypothetical protein
MRASSSRLSVVNSPGSYPAHKRSSLIERTGLALDQRQIMQRVEYEILALIRTSVAGNLVGTAADDDFANVASHEHLPVTVGDGDRIVVVPIANQRQGAGPSADLFTGVVRSIGKRQQCGTVALETLGDCLGMAAKPHLQSLTARPLEILIELVETVMMRDRN